MQISNLVLNNNVTFFVDMQGSRVILLQARIDNKNDMPRLYSLAQEKLNEIVSLLRLAA